MRYPESNPGRRSRWVVLLTGVVALLLVGGAVPAAQAGTGDATALKGTWIGTFSGYDTDGYKSGNQKLVITKAKGSSASGTYTYKFQFPAKGKWSKPQPMNLSIFDQEETANGMVDYISGADELGMHTGKHDKADDTLIFSHVSRSQNVVVLTFNLKRKS